MPAREVMPAIILSALSVVVLFTFLMLQSHNHRSSHQMERMIGETSVPGCTSWIGELGTVGWFGYREQCTLSIIKDANGAFGAITAAHCFGDLPIFGLAGLVVHIKSGCQNQIVCSVDSIARHHSSDVALVNLTSCSSEILSSATVNFEQIQVGDSLTYEIQSLY